MTRNFSRKQAQLALPKRVSTDNKTRGGKTLIIAGSTGMWGAAVLAAQAAARSGAGYVYLKTEGRFPVELHPDFLQTQKIVADGYDAIAVGPGLSDLGATQKILRQLLRNSKTPVLVDATGLRALSKMKSIPKFPSNWILTPHAGELSALLNMSSEEIDSNRIKAIHFAQKKFGAVVLLKGSPTLVADGKSVVKITSGNAALAKAGTGDVLTGIIAAFVSQGVPSPNAACLGAYVHGMIAAQWLRDGKDILSLMASDLITELPKTLHSLRPPKTSREKLSQKKLKINLKKKK